MSARAKKLVIAGGGFAGVWASAAASALRHQTGRCGDVEIVLVSRDAELTLRPRLYEERPDTITLPLSPITRSLDVALVRAEIDEVDLPGRRLVTSGGGRHDFDAVVLAMGSCIARPDIPGLAEFAHDVDSLATSRAFWDSVARCRDGATIAVVGAGLTGLELVTEVAAKGRFNTLLIDSRRDFSHLYAPEAARIIEAALAGTRTKLGCRVAAIDRTGVRLATGEHLAADLVTWTAGMRANPLTDRLGHRTDELGRLVADPYLRIEAGVYAAGDMAHVRADPDHAAPMSCQFAIPTGITAGHNAMAELLGAAPREFLHPSYVTCTDLGAAGGLFTQGWAREPVSSGATAKETKQAIMRMICPPTEREALYAIATPD